MLRAQIKGRIAGSWGSPQQPPSCLAQAMHSTCRWPLLRCTFWLPVTQTQSQVRQHGAVPPPSPSPDHCDPTGELCPWFLLKRAHLPQLLWGDLAKAHSIPRNQFSLSCFPFLSHEFSVKRHEVLNNNLWKNISTHRWLNSSVESQF